MAPNSHANCCARPPGHTLWPPTEQDAHLRVIHRRPKDVLERVEVDQDGHFGREGQVGAVADGLGLCVLEDVFSAT